MPRSSSAGGRAALLWLAAAAISAFTMWRHLEPFDEGFLLQAATRMAGGQWPYGDFGWPYGPGQPLLVAAAFDLFEPSVVWWRVLRVATDASIAVLVWALVRPEAGGRWALVGWLAAAVTIAQPTTANPFAAALALGLGAVLAAARGKPVAAGLLVALTAFWRPDLDALAGLAALAAAAGGQTPHFISLQKGVRPLTSFRCRKGSDPWPGRRSRRRRSSTRPSPSRRGPVSCGTRWWPRRPVTGDGGGCRSRSPTTGRCAGGRRGSSPRTSRTRSATTCR